MGFSLAGLSRIARCPLTFALDNRVQGVRFAASDRFCLDGQPLVLLAGTYGGDRAEYRTEIHGLQKVLSRGRQGSGPLSFEVQQPDGLIWHYGNDADSRLSPVGSKGEVREWAINQVTDKFGNQMVFTWLNDPLTGESLPLEIRWAGSGSGAAPLPPGLRLWDKARQGSASLPALGHRLAAHKAPHHPALRVCSGQRLCPGA